MRRGSPRLCGLRLRTVCSGADQRQATQHSKAKNSLPSADNIFFAESRVHLTSPSFPVVFCESGSACNSPESRHARNCANCAAQTAASNSSKSCSVLFVAAKIIGVQLLNSMRATLRGTCGAGQWTEAGLFPYYFRTHNPL